MALSGVVNDWYLFKAHKKGEPLSTSSSLTASPQGSEADNTK